MRVLIALTLFVYSFSLIHAQQEELLPEDNRSILAVVKMQEDAWNNGDIVKFMSGYWNSEHTVFTGAAGPIFGWDKVMSRYLKSYPDRKTMGKTRLEVIDLYLVDKKVALMSGKYELTRLSGNLRGYFTLVWNKIDGDWLIISDHTTASNSQ